MSTSLFSSLDDLIGLTRHEGIDTRPTLLRVLTDLYVQQPAHTDDEIEQFTELALRLIEQVDIPTRIDVARRLAGYGAVPALVVRRLACDVTEVADAILSRPSAAAPVLQTNDDQITDRARSNLPSADQGAATVGELFFSANAEERADILTDLASIEGAATLSAPTDTAATVQRLETAALQGRPHEFVREIERSLALPRRQAEQIVNDASGEPLLVIAKALATPIDVLQRILLLVNPAIGTSVRRVFDLSALYENSAMSSALRLVALWRRPAGVRREPEPATQHVAEGGDARRIAAGIARGDTAMPASPRRGQRAS